MKSITLYYNKDCARCARLARIDRFLDWFGRLHISTDIPPTGPLRIGQIMVEDMRTRTSHFGADAFSLLCRNLPLYAPLRLLLLSKRFRRRIEQQLGGCDDSSCGPD
jgi:hypothetical protein